MNHVFPVQAAHVFLVVSVLRWLWNLGRKSEAIRADGNSKEVGRSSPTKVGGLCVCKMAP